MDNIIADKVDWCKKFGICIKQEDWNCNALPGTFVTDKGKEYTSYIFEQLTDLGVSIINLQPYRPDLKSRIDKKLHNSHYVAKRNPQRLLGICGMVIWAHKGTPSMCFAKKLH